jgi:hypothetical protein
MLSDEEVETIKRLRIRTPKYAANLNLIAP